VIAHRERPLANHGGSSGRAHERLGAPGLGRLAPALQAQAPRRSLKDEPPPRVDVTARNARADHRDVRAARIRRSTFSGLTREIRGATESSADAT
jgi:hypothetical protein